MFIVKCQNHPAKKTQDSENHIHGLKMSCGFLLVFFFALEQRLGEEEMAWDMSELCGEGYLQTNIHTFTDAGRICDMPVSDTIDFIPLSSSGSQNIIIFLH